MTIVQVHILMIALGALAFLLLAGVYSSRSIRKRRKPWITILAGLAIAASPFSRLWRETTNGMELLTQSILVSVICLLVLLLLALLMIPIRSYRRARKSRRKQEQLRLANESSTESSTGGLPPITIDAEAKTEQSTDEAAVATAPATDTVTNFAPIQNAGTAYRLDEKTHKVIKSSAIDDPAHLSAETNSAGATIDKSQSANKTRRARAIENAERIRAEQRREEQKQAESLRVEEREAERLKSEQQLTEKLRVEKEQTEKEQAAKLQAEKQKAQKLEEERLQAERLQAEKLRAEKLKTEELEAKRVEAERLEAEKIEAKRVEAERLEAEKRRAQKLEAERLEAKRLAKEKLQAEELEAKRIEAEILRAEKLEAEKLQSEQKTQKIEKGAKDKGSIMPSLGLFSAKKTAHASTGQMDKSISGSVAANDKNTLEPSSLDADSSDDDLHDPFLSPVSHSLLADEELATPTMPSGDDALDLTETEQLFAEIRAKNTGVELPDDKEVQDATQRVSPDRLDFDSNLVNEDISISSSIGNNIEEEIEEAEVLEVEILDENDASLEFGSDLTGEYAQPTAQSEDAQRFNDNTVTQQSDVPQNLGDAMLAAKSSALSVQGDVSILEHSIQTLETIREEQAQLAATNIKEQQDALKKMDELLAAEDQARAAAEAVIAAQNDLIERTKKQKTLAHSLLQREKQRLALMAVEVERSRKMARTAAQLARKAAIAQQEIRDVAKREQTARLKSQESTRKAVTIARNAISALAAEERKRGHTRH